MNRSLRTDYDAVAPSYDTQPHRTRTVDPEFFGFTEQRASSDPLSLLDIACGTGNQLIANRTVGPDATLVGVDQSIGMLRQAARKAPDITWVQADAATLPFPDRSFDFASCQFAFHHFQDKARMLREAFRVLRVGGRFVLRNSCPQESSDWLHYEYFLEAELRDLRDFWPPDALMAVMEGAGFTPVTVQYEHLRFEQKLRDWLEIVQRRDTCSQLQSISDAAYAAGVRRLERELADGSAPPTRSDHLCHKLMGSLSPQSRAAQSGEGGQIRPQSAGEAARAHRRLHRHDPRARESR
jgi:SAM-dependent methyltransferase